MKVGSTEVSDGVARLMQEPCRQCGAKVVNWSEWTWQQDEDFPDDETKCKLTVTGRDIRSICENKHLLMISW